MEKNNSSKYRLVAPESYTTAQAKYIKDFVHSVEVLSQHSNLMLIMMDTNCHFITGTDLSAGKFGLKSGADLVGRSWLDIPCKSIVEFGEELNRQAKQIMSVKNLDNVVETLNVFEFSDGLRARVSSNRVFYDKASKAILGKVGVAHDVELKDFINIIPSYILRFGALGTIDRIDQKTIIADDLKLNDYEQELCFLFLLGWSFTQVAEFMNIYRPNETPRNGDTIIKKKNYICQKLRIPTTNINDLCEYLFAINFHKKMPRTFYAQIIGTKVIA